MSNLRSLIAAEWLKLRRRPLTWGLFGLFVVLLIFYLSTWLLVVAAYEGRLGDGSIRVQILGEAQIAELKRQISFPGIFGTVFGQINSIGGICAIILAGAVMGGEYGWGTLRIQLSHAPDRRAALLARVLTLFALLIVAVLFALLIGSLFALLAGQLLALPQAFGSADLLRLPLAIARSLLVIAPYLLFAISCAILGRSAVAGVGGGLLFLAFDLGLGSLEQLAQLNPLIAALTRLLIQPNINALVVANSRSFGLNPEVLTTSLDLSRLPPPWQAGLVVAAYTLLFGYTALRALTRRDIGGAN